MDSAMAADRILRPCAPQGHDTARETGASSAAKIEAWAVRRPGNIRAASRADSRDMALSGLRPDMAIGPHTLGPIRERIRDRIGELIRERIRESIQEHRGSSRAMVALRASGLLILGLTVPAISILVKNLRDISMTGSTSTEISPCRARSNCCATIPALTACLPPISSD
jgi:hypothetical protein